MPKICPCQNEMNNDSFLFTVLIIDVVANIWSVILFIFPLIGIFINLKEKNYNSAIFGCWGWFRYISTIIILVIGGILIILLSIILIATTKTRDNENNLFTAWVVLFVLAFVVIPVNIWEFYVFKQYIKALDEEREKDMKKELSEDIEENENQTTPKEMAKKSSENIKEEIDN